MNFSNQPSAEARKYFSWFRIYSLFLAFVYFLCVLAGVAMTGIGIHHVSNGIKLEDDGEIMFIVFGIFLAITGILLFLPFAAAPFLPRRPWVWLFTLVLICIGLTSPCFLPICIPLLIRWMKPEMKAFFGKS